MRRVMTPLLFLIVAAPAAADDGSPSQFEFFETKVRPVLVEHCYGCHSAQAKKLKGGLRLDSREAMLRGGDNGPALVPGDIDRSRLVTAIGYKDVDLQMPPRAKLSDSAVADLTAWVKMGAPWPRERAAVAGAKGDFDLAARRRQHWCWQPLRPQATPAVQDTAWPLGAVDRFVLAPLEAKGLRPAPPTDARTLLRRIYFDLVGLPPPPQAVSRFEREAAVNRQNAVARVVDELLESPHFGERWGRHWLDLVRFAESRGHEFDYRVPNAYQYRDYVIRALNADVPYDRLVTEHVAGDLLPEPRRHPQQGFNESILGTGFWFLGEQLHSPVDICQDKADRFDNMIDVFGKAFLGLTIACARCHDHKFDAISTRDYYSLCGFLESSSYRLVPFDTLEHNRDVARRLARLRAEGQARLLRAGAVVLLETPEVDSLLGSHYLMAAYQVVTSPPERHITTRLARELRLDPRLLQRWVACLQSAATDATSPLHVFAKVAVEKQGEKLLQQWRRQRAEAAASWRAADVIVDYGRSDSAWLPDGFAYGPRPQQSGDLRFESHAGGMRFRLEERAAAAYDPAWEALHPSASAELDPGALEKIQRPGLTLRTPTFQVSRPRVWYLVRGQGFAYAAVEAHGMIAGPLHGQLVKTLNAGSGFQWLEHDLAPYRGRRAHVEFTPAPGSPFAVAAVVQADAPPSLSEPNPFLFELLESHSKADPAQLASAYQDLFQEVMDRLMIGAPHGPGLAPLVNWLLHEPDPMPLGPATWLPHTAPLFPVAAVNRAFYESQVRLFDRPKFPRSAIAYHRQREAEVAAEIRSASRLAPALLDGSGVDEQVFIRGNYKTPGDPAPRRFLEALVGEKPLRVADGSGRLDLARQMTDPVVTPLLPRVLVNRVWHHLFGRGLVASVDNFGVLGEPPSHPELLDYLATQFVADGWSLKRLLRSLMLSRAYQMSSHGDAAAMKVDPQNLLLHRANVRRLEGEAIRDAMLAVSGRLEPKLFGPSVAVHLTDFQQGRGRPASGPLDGDGRRSIYLAIRRNFLSSLLLAFDTPIPFATVGKRSVSNVPAQALILLNDPFVHKQADTWARQVLKQPASTEDRIRGMYVSAFARPPDEEEVRACVAYLGEQQRSGSQAQAWAALAHVLFNAKEFIFLP